MPILLMLCIHNAEVQITHLSLYLILPYYIKSNFSLKDKCYYQNLLYNIFQIVAITFKTQYTMKSTTFLDEMPCSLVQKFTDVSEEHTVYIISVEE
jgi:hypothetical protein